MSFGPRVCPKSSSTQTKPSEWINFSTASKCPSGKKLNHIESDVIQGRQPDSGGAADVDEREPGAIRPRQVALPQ